MTPVVTFDECQTPLLGTPSGGILLGPWMPMVFAATDGFEECAASPVALSEQSTPAVSLAECTTTPVTIVEGGI